MGSLLTGHSAEPQMMLRHQPCPKTPGQFSFGGHGRGRGRLALASSSRAATRHLRGALWAVCSGTASRGLASKSSPGETRGGSHAAAASSMVERGVELDHKFYPYGERRGQKLLMRSRDEDGQGSPHSVSQRMDRWKDRDRLLPT